jgi:hypothetical protein
MQAPYDRKTGQFVSLPLRMRGVVSRGADADELSNDDTMSYDELKGDLLTIGWNSHQMVELVHVDVDGEEYETPDGEVRGTYAAFCAMSLREQTTFMYRLTMHICDSIGVSICEWEPSDAFVLDAIQDELTNDELRKRAYSAYLATPFPHEGNPSDEDTDLIGREEDDTIRISQQSEHDGELTARNRANDCDKRYMSRRRPRFACHGDWRKQVSGTSRERRRARMKMESHYAKCGRQDYRHQLPRIEAKFDRHLAAYEALLEADAQSSLERLMIEDEHSLRFAREVEDLDCDYSSLAYSDHALNCALDEMQDFCRFGPRLGTWDFTDDFFSYRDLDGEIVGDILGLHGYLPVDSRRRIAERAWSTSQEIQASLPSIDWSPIARTRRHHHASDALDGTDQLYFGQSSGKIRAYRRHVSHKELELSL